MLDGVWRFLKEETAKKLEFTSHQLWAFYFLNNRLGPRLDWPKWPSSLRENTRAHSPLAIKWCKRVLFKTMYQTRGFITILSGWEHGIEMLIMYALILLHCLVFCAHALWIHVYLISEVFINYITETLLLH